MYVLYREANEVAVARDEGEGKREQCVAVREQESEAPIIIESAPSQNMYVL